MRETVKILVISGSSRKESLNKKLAKIAFDLLEEDIRVEANFIDFADYPMPMYNGDLEVKEGLPANARKLKEIFIDSDGFIIASPEYNGSIPPLLKNALDWISRAEEADEKPLVSYTGKIVAIMSASPSTLGGLRGLYALRYMLENIYTMVIPSLVTIREADKAFDEKDKFMDSKNLERVKSVVKELVDIVYKNSVR